MSVRTHYDNLQVPQDADADAIRRAYRRLSKQYHPDLNQDEDAHRIMQLINQAYSVLSDPEKRAEHDRWIAAQNRPQPQYTIHIRTTPTVPPQAAAPAPPAPRRNPAFWWLLGATALTGLLGWQLFQLFSERYAPQLQAAASAAAADSAPAASGAAGGAAPAKPEAKVAPLPPAIAEAPPQIGYIRPDTAPNGTPWPKASGYIDGYAQTRGRGSMTLYVDNIRNPSDVFAELFAGKGGEPVRTFFIEERSHLILDRLDAGSYHIRYRQLDNGDTLESEQIILQQGGKEATVYLQRAAAAKP